MLIAGTVRDRKKKKSSKIRVEGDEIERGGLRHPDVVLDEHDRTHMFRKSNPPARLAHQTGVGVGGITPEKVHAIAHSVQW